MNILGIIASQGGAAAAVGDFESIATVTVGSGGASDITFSSIPATYQHLQIRALSKHSSSGGDVFAFQFNGTTGNSYAWHRLVGTGASVVADAGTTTDRIFAALAPGSSSTNIFGVHIIDILDYADTNKNTTARTLNGYDTNGGGELLIRSGLFNNTAAISSIKFFFSSGNFAQYTHFALYGIKG